MRYLIATQCRIRRDKMQEFFTEVQQWEKAAMNSADAPERHAVYLHRADPTRALVLTTFESKERADGFAGTGLLERFRERLMSCAGDVGEADGFDLFYAAGIDGHHVIFGEDA
jgi:hypothetical protein